MNSLGTILFYLIFFIWLLPPIMQFKERYFYFFLLLGLTEIIAIGFKLAFGISTEYTYISISYLLILSLFSKEILKRYWLVLIFGCLFILVFFHFFNDTKYKTIYYSIFIIFHFLIFLKILLTFIIEIEKDNSIKFFFLIFLLYELTVIFKFINLITGFVDAYPYFIITSVFEIFIGLFFSIFKEDDTRIVFKLK